MRCTVRRAGRRADWTEATALLHDYVAWAHAAFGTDLRVEQPALAIELDDLERSYGGDDAALFLARLGRLAVGTVAIRCGSGGAELKRLYVRPVARGRGIGDTLVEAALRFAAGRGAAAVWLETSADVMAPAIALYRRHGFVPTAEPGRTLRLDGLLVMERRCA